MATHTRIAAALIASLALLASSTHAQDAKPVAVAQPESAESIGSLRNARVAFPNPQGKTLTVLVGSVSPDQIAELKKASPNLNIVQVRNNQQAMEHAAEAHAVDARFATPEFLAKAPNLVWVMAMSAGVDHLLDVEPLMKNDRIVITNMRAIHGPAIADHSFAMLLSLTRNMREHAQNQEQGRWGRGGSGGAAGGGVDPTSRSIALQGRTMLVVGLGGIGTEIAQRAHGFGMRVTAIRRSDAPSPEYVEK